MKIYRYWMYLRWRMEKRRNQTPQEGMFWHVHHDMLCEYCYDYEGRAEYIIWYKPTEEIKLRLRLFRPMKGELPDGLRPEDLSCYRDYQELLQAKKDALEELHRKECPKCPWNGHLIL